MVEYIYRSSDYPTGIGKDQQVGSNTEGQDARTQKVAEISQKLSDFINGAPIVTVSKLAIDILRGDRYLEGATWLGQMEGYLNGDENFLIISDDAANLSYAVNGDYWIAKKVNGAGRRFYKENIGACRTAQEHRRLALTIFENENYSESLLGAFKA